MKEHPILFSGPMVRAICEGRKTMTRRVVDRVYQKGLSVMTTMPKSPYGYPGDRLWVRETWAQDLDGEVFYAADHLSKPTTIEKWRPSIFMPRTISRIMLEIEDVRVSWLHDISADDARSEGIEEHCDGGCEPHCNACNEIDRDTFRRLWDSINKKRGFGWDTNPGVWVVKFHRL